MKKVPDTILRFLFLAVVFLTGCRIITSEKKSSVPGDDTPAITVAGSGMDSLKLARIPSAMQRFVDEQKMAGSVTLVARNGHITSFEAVGFRNYEKKIPMTGNTLFRIASMTKPFSAAAILMLAEEGRLNITDPVEKYLPEFRNLWLISEREAEKMILIRPSRPITIKDVLTHTSGVANLPANVTVRSIAEYTLVVSQNPLQFEPGSQWKYSNAGINIAARVVEKVSGMPYEIFLSERIFNPLGMKNTSFSVRDDFRDKIADLYHPSADSLLEFVEAPDWYGYPHPEGGLISNAIDLYKWMQALLNKGIYNGTRILQEGSVEEMTRIQTGELATGFTEGMSFGLGVGVVREPSGVTAMLSKGTFGHGGAFGTNYWADPVSNIIYILLIQRQEYGNGDASDIRKTFQEIAAGSIIK